MRRVDPARPSAWPSKLGPQRRAGREPRGLKRGPVGWSGGRADGGGGLRADGSLNADPAAPPTQHAAAANLPGLGLASWACGLGAWLGPGLGLAWAWRGPMHGTPPSYPTCANATLSQISSLRFEMSAWTRTKIAVWQMHRGWGRVPARRIHIFEDMKISCDTIVWSFKTGGELILDWFEGYCSEVRLSCVG